MAKLSTKALTSLAKSTSTDLTSEIPKINTPKLSDGFIDATEEMHSIKLPLKILIGGFAGSGKTWLASLIANSLKVKTAMLDTQYPQSLAYRDIFKYDKVLQITKYDVPTLIKALQYAKQDCGTIIIDSLSHSWFAEGGILDVADKAKIKYGGFDVGGWAEARPLENKLIQEIYISSANIIATVRMKSGIEIVKGPKGKNEILKAPPKMIHAKTIPNEFNIVFRVDQKNDRHLVYPLKWLKRNEMLNEVFTNPDADSDLIKTLVEDFTGSNA